MSKKSFNVILSNREGAPELFKTIVDDIYTELQDKYNMLNWTDSCQRESSNDLVYKLEARHGWTDGLDIKIVYSNAVEDVNVTVDPTHSFDMFITGLLIVSSMLVGALIATAAAWDKGVIGIGTFVIGGFIGLVVGAILAAIMGNVFCFLCIPKRFRIRNQNRVDQVVKYCEKITERSLNPQLPKVEFSNLHGEDCDWHSSVKGKRGAGWLVFLFAVINLSIYGYATYLKIEKDAGALSELLSRGSSEVIQNELVEEEYIEEQYSLEDMNRDMLSSEDEYVRVGLAQEILKQDKNNLDARYVIGLAFHRGIAVTKDEKAAFVSFNLAAGDGHVKAQLGRGL